jgi:hypothetical protein
LIILLFIGGCSNKNYMSKNSQDSGLIYQNTKAKPDSSYVPIAVIDISDEFAKINKEGEIYFDNELGYRYWKLSDGKFYLDAKYLSEKASKKKGKKYHIKKINEEYANQ